MTRVYAIRTGAYSDTSWGPVFSTVENAIAYCDKINGGARSYYDGAEVEVHVLDEEEDPEWYPSWLIVFDTNGVVISNTKETAKLFEPLLEPDRIKVQIPPTDNRWYFLDDPGVREQAALVVRSVVAPNLQCAIEIASDARGMWLQEHPV